MPSKRAEHLLNRIRAQTEKEPEERERNSRRKHHLSDSLRYGIGEQESYHREAGDEHAVGGMNRGCDTDRSSQASRPAISGATT